MRKILVANPKGGCGKSTLAVHLASWFARHDEIVYLGDLDRQQSSRHWLKARPAHLAGIQHWKISPEQFEMPPANCNFAILDTPAGLHGKSLKQALNAVDKVVVPVSPSRFDLLTTREFFEELAETKAVRKERVDIGVVGMRVDLRTHAYDASIDLSVLPRMHQRQAPLSRTADTPMQRASINAVRTLLAQEKGG